MAQLFGVGYRVSSVRATKFRQWATQVLREYIRKCFAMDDERLKQGTAFFWQGLLLERVRSIRASERRIWQQITDIYAECSIKGNTFTMKQFTVSVDKFLSFNDYKILPDRGRISATEA